MDVLVRRNLHRFRQVSYRSRESFRFVTTAFALSRHFCQLMMRLCRFFQARQPVAGTPNSTLAEQGWGVVVSGKPRISTRDIASLIEAEVEKFGPWPAGLTVKINLVGKTWNASIRANSPPDALYRDNLAAVAVNLKKKYNPQD